MKAGIYARVSLDQTGQGRSVTEQEDECRAWAAREGWDVVDVITETGSASRFARSTGARTRWRDVVDLIGSGRIEILLTWEASRATRQLSEYAELATTCARHGVLWGYSGTVYDLGKREDRFRTGLDALLSEDESARSSERIRRAVRARAAAGAPHGKLPYGYRREYDPSSGALLRQVPDETTAPVVQEIIRRVAAGDSLYSIARDLTDRGVPMPRPARSRDNPGRWIPVTVRRIAQSPTYAGKRIHRGVVVGDATWEALVDENLHEQAVAALEEMNARSHPRADRSVKHLLSGIARCGTCDARMQAHTNRGTPSYWCSAGFCTTRRREPVDELVVERLLMILAAIHDARDSPDVDDPALAAARGEVLALHTRLSSFIDQAADGELTAASLARVEARLRPQIEEAERRVRTLARPPLLTGYDLSDPAALWRRLSLAERRDLVARTLTVTIHPAGRGARRFDPTKVDVRPAW